MNKFLIIIICSLLLLFVITTKYTDSRENYRNELGNKLEELRYNLIENKNLRESEKLSILNAGIEKMNEIEISITKGKTLQERTTEIIAEVARQENFKGKDLLIRIAKAESSLNPDAIGKIDKDDWGLYQINQRHNPIGEKCAFCVWCSTRWVINEINNGNLWKWNASKHNWN